MKRRYLLVTVTALAVAFSSTAFAGTTLYGNLKYSFNKVDMDRTGGTDGLTAVDNVSRIGLKGTYGEDIKAFFHLQTSAAADASGTAFGSRFFMGGLKGNFGKVAYGRMTNAYKFPGFALDPFYDHTGVNASGTIAGGGATYGLSGATNGFTNNALQYFTPKLGPATVVAGVYVDDSNADDHAYLLGVSAAPVDGLNAGVVWATDNQPTGGTSLLPSIAAGESAIRGYATYKMDNMKFGLSVERLNQAPGTDDQTYFYLTGTLTVPDMKTDFSASVGKVSDGPAKGTGFNLGAFYGITENTKLFGLWSYASLDDISGADVESKPSAISIGVKHNFSIGGK